MQLLANTTSPFVRIVRIAMLEKGLEPDLHLVDPWADDPRLRAANAATRVPTLILDDGTVLSECLLIAQWLEATRGPPAWPSLFGKPQDTATVLAHAGIAIGAIEASTITIISRKVTAPILFDETPVGLRRRRTMVESLQRLEAIYASLQAQGDPKAKASEHSTAPGEGAAAPAALDVICAVVLFDYQRFRYGTQAWLPHTPALQKLADAMNARESFATTRPH